jgi:hypothetical protein
MTSALLIEENWEVDGRCGQYDSTSSQPPNTNATQQTTRGCMRLLAKRMQVKEKKIYFFSSNFHESELFLSQL